LVVEMLTTAGATRSTMSANDTGGGAAGATPGAIAKAKVISSIRRRFSQPLDVVRAGATTFTRRINVSPRDPPQPLAMVEFA
jgi:hypothetical protein